MRGRVLLTTERERERAAEQGNLGRADLEKEREESWIQKPYAELAFYIYGSYAEQ